jgi:hypothetical protein
MVKGIRVPIGVDVYGGTAIVEESEYKHQLIVLSLSSGDSANAFQQEISLGQDMIFGQDTQSLRSSVMQRLFTIFTEFERDKLFQLMKETIKWTPLGDGQLELSFSYIDIETDTVLSFRKEYTVGA